MSSKTIKKSSFVSLTFRGFMILIPIVAAVYLFKDLYQKIQDWINNIISTTPLNSPTQVVISAVIAAILIFLLAYIIGAVSNSKVVVEFAKKVDEFLINNSEIYRKIKLQLDNSAEFVLQEKPPVFIRFGDAERPGFLMQPADQEGRAVVFIPKDFKNFDGHVYIVLEENIRHSKADSTDFVFSLEHLGVNMDIE